MNKEKQFTYGPSFDVIGFHLDTVEDILELIEECQSFNREQMEENNRIGLLPSDPCPDEKLDELKHYVEKLKRYIMSDEN